MNAGTTDYRERIYRRYSSARERVLAPDTLDGFGPRVPFLNRIIRNHFPRDRSAAILDLGCGHGALVYLAHQAGYRNIRAVDGSPEQVAEAKRLGIDGVVQGDLMESLRSLADESQDCIVALDVIEHFTKAELLPFIDEVYRVLRSEGRWIIHTPNAESPFGGRIRYGMETSRMSWHLHVHRSPSSCWCQVFRGLPRTRMCLSPTG